MPSAKNKKTFNALFGNRLHLITLMKMNDFYLSQDNRVLVSSISAAAATIFLFYIDEGAYNFRWMAHAGNWIPFVFYTGILLGIQLFVSEVVLIFFNGRVKTVASVLMSVILVILMMLAFSK